MTRRNKQQQKIGEQQQTFTVQTHIQLHMHRHTLPYFIRHQRRVKEMLRLAYDTTDEEFARAWRGRVLILHNRTSRALTTTNFRDVLANVQFNFVESVWSWSRKPVFSRRPDIVDLPLEFSA